ncbi:TetR/AcrR family transcriptional regulator [Planotetraspora mira]|uniref:TetR/AcrR family transcriptional regulator n=1 Tax=Planotetraspora mira TaxID=58121 RepID=UPI00194E12E0|nr:TetR/AcrR family transcriptional regulator [Planotetraspora mira]
MATGAQHGYEKGRAKRREIIDRAVTLFGEVGYRGASLREIAARCGISHPGLLHHFPTKESLLLAVLEHRDEVDGQWLSIDGATGMESLRRLVGLVSMNAARRGIVELFAVLSAEATSATHPAHDYFVERYRTSVATFELAYTRARDEGILRPGIDPGMAGRQLVALMDGLQVQWLLDDCVTDMAGIVRAHVQGQLTEPL